MKTALTTIIFAVAMWLGVIACQNAQEPQKRSLIGPVEEVTGTPSETGTFTPTATETNTMTPTQSPTPTP